MRPGNLPSAQPDLLSGGGAGWPRPCRIAALALAFAALSQGALWAEVLESMRRQDPTGLGSFHRIGLLRELENSYSLSTGPEIAETEPPAAGEGFPGILDLQLRSNSMLFSSDNIFNTSGDEQEDFQYAEFLGVSLDLEWNDRWKLETGFDQAFFLYGDGDNSENDFRTSTVRQALNYRRYFLDNKLGLNLPVSWQYSGLFNRDSGDRLLDTFTLGTGAEFSWFARSWMIPTFSYQYTYLDNSSPDDPAPEKHKHDFNLGVTFLPWEGGKLFIVPSVQFSHEYFLGPNRTDDSWTPTLLLSWQPRDWLTLNAVLSYTDSDSNVRGASYDALAGTLFVRIYKDW